MMKGNRISWWNENADIKNYFKVVQGETVEDAILEEGKGFLSTGKNSEFEELAKNIKNDKIPIVDAEMKEKIEDRV